MSDIKTRLGEDIKTSMKSGDKERLATLRMISAAIKQREVDERIELNDQQALVVLDKMCKQRRESITQFDKAGRDDLTAIEQKELAIIQDFMPSALTEAEIQTMITAAISKTAASSIKDMGKVMGLLKPEMQGRADMSVVSAKIRSLLDA